MLQLSGAGKRFGTKLLFENVNWLITPDERTALVGANGTGKSTLMKILAGNDTHEGGLDYGTMQRTKGMSIGYLPQDGLSLSGRSVFDECLTVFDELRAMETELEGLYAALAELDPESPEYQTAADRFSEIDSRFTRQRWLCARCEGRHGAERSRLQQRRLAAADGRIFRRLADAHRAGETAAPKA